MALPLYLAMTAAEIQENSSIPTPLAYMACHFSPYGTGLSNFPRFLPKESLLILNDRTPIHGHDWEQIREELESIVETHQCSGILLDFQRPGFDELRNLAKLLTGSFPCPVAVSEPYAQGLPCPVFLPPVPHNVPVSEYLLPWDGREIWLEAALDAIEITITPLGYKAAPGYPHQNGTIFPQDALHCHYHVTVEPDQAVFSLFRTREDLDDLLAEAEALGVTRAIGLWQELFPQQRTPA